jgi:hypothetical protein
LTYLFPNLSPPLLYRDAEEKKEEKKRTKKRRTGQTTPGPDPAAARRRRRRGLRVHRCTVRSGSCHSSQHDRAP